MEDEGRRAGPGRERAGLGPAEPAQRGPALVSKARRMWGGRRGQGQTVLFY